MHRLSFGLICLFVGVVPWEGLITVEPVGTLSKLVGILAFGAALVMVLGRGQIRRPSPFLILATLYLCWGLLSYWWSLDQTMAAARSVTQLQLLLLVWTIWEVVREPAEHRVLMQWYVVGSWITAGLVLWSWIIGRSLGATLYDRFTAYDKDANEIGFIIALAVPMAWYLAITARRRHVALLNGVFVLLGTLAVLLTGSRSAFLALACGLMLIPATYRYLTTLQKGLVIAVVLLGAIGLGSGARPSSVDRILTLGEEVGSAVASQGEDNLRIRIWRRGLEQWAQRTILGVGLGSYKSSIASESRGHSVAPHSSFVAILVEQGAIGFLLFLLMMANLVQVAWRSRAVERTLFLLLLLSWSAGVMFMQQDYKKHTWVVFALVAAASSRRPVPSEPGLPVAYSELPEAKWAG